MTGPSRSTSRTTLANRTATGLAAGLVLALAAPLPAQAAQALEPSGAPVTVDDTHQILGTGPMGPYARGYSVNVLANDSDPDGDELELCEVSVPEGAPLGAFPDEQAAERGNPGWLRIESSRNRSASYDVTYYACDAEHRSPGILTVDVVRIEPVVGTAGRRPGRARFTNPGPFDMTVSYGRHLGDPERYDHQGEVAVAAGASVSVPVPGRRIGFRAYVPEGGYADGGRGVVRGIRSAAPRG